ncbi:hypothetical protein MRB53_030223 [Persea americana]|uniref:Uncharacterized protein n=1 Tax=Persea americana TaxID=3435 RepID=A0ACC2KKK4_PERAE|nr:hypothetical protein MRB53_030223 [Persea americana]
MSQEIPADKRHRPTSDSEGHCPQSLASHMETDRHMTEGTIQNTLATGTAQNGDNAMVFDKIKQVGIHVRATHEVQPISIPSPGYLPQKQSLDILNVPSIPLPPPSINTTHPIPSDPSSPNSMNSENTASLSSSKNDGIVPQLQQQHRAASMGVSVPTTLLEHRNNNPMESGEQHPGLVL